MAAPSWNRSGQSNESLPLVWHRVISKILTAWQGAATEGRPYSTVRLVLLAIGNYVFDDSEELL